jgi:hypothetical protein
VPPEVADAWGNRPWFRVCATEPSWDCDLPTWRTEFAGAVPSTPFRVIPAGAEDGGLLPDDVRVERAAGDWMVRMADGSYWDGLVENGWTDMPDAEKHALTFPTEADAVAAFFQANRMYEERAERQEKALDRLDELDAQEDLEDNASG